MLNEKSTLFQNIEVAHCSVNKRTEKKWKLATFEKWDEPLKTFAMRSWNPTPHHKMANEQHFPVSQAIRSIIYKIQSTYFYFSKGRAATNACTICVSTDFRQPHECLLLHYALWAQNWFLIWPNWLLFWAGANIINRKKHKERRRRPLQRERGVYANC